MTLTKELMWVSRSGRVICLPLDQHFRELCHKFSYNTVTFPFFIHRLYLVKLNIIKQYLWLDETLRICHTKETYARTVKYKGRDRRRRAQGNKKHKKTTNHVLWKSVPWNRYCFECRYVVWYDYTMSRAHTYKAKTSSQTILSIQNGGNRS